jgi:hypothetical protein
MLGKIRETKRADVHTSVCRKGNGNCQLKRGFLHQSVVSAFTTKAVVLIRCQILC